MTSKRKCRHDNLRGIYGDEIVARRMKRSQCRDCGKLFEDLPPMTPDDVLRLTLRHADVCEERDRYRDVAEAVIASWDSSTYQSERPDCLQVNVNRKAWAAFCALVEKQDK